ncbi:4Fe-4S ferredoxin [Hanstruepera neustonica]|uniref:4Fe-4S ferredoxin n=1 Tax=Hanstruepera neustonica TaxID=1445657 RepID=A0A2K1DXW8_9FLAO|nr:NAD(P)-binding domain-containing protein [Hanstruepera neustonica]PNQ72879.1 4Fe-4S ferredoxin [Hanstruepera neustonica]
MSDLLLEEIIVYGAVFLLCALIIGFYLLKKNKSSKVVAQKVATAKEEGLFEPVSLHPYINPDICIGSGACVRACPEKDILGIVNGKATVINASNCVGHGACFHACPVEAISLRIGTETRGVDLPHVNQNFETNMPGIFIAGELGGMGLIKNSVEQGQQAMDSIAKSKSKASETEYDVAIVGAGPAGISATLAAKKHGLKAITLEQDSLGGTVYTFPRAKVVMTSPMELPLHGKVKLFNTSKDELLTIWNEVIDKHDLDIVEQTKVEDIVPQANQTFKVVTNQNTEYVAQNVLLAIGRRGTPRKLDVPGEVSEKVAYRLLDSETIENKQVLVVGGGDSAIESALLLKDRNTVTLSYRKDKFSRLKPANKDNVLKAEQDGSLQIIFESNVTEINDNHVHLELQDGSTTVLDNDLVYIFAGGELPTKFLERAGIEITKRFGYIVKKYR